MSLVSLRIPYCWGMIMMLDLLNKIASMEFPRIQKQNEKLVREYMAESRATPMDQQDLAEEIGIDDICKIAPNRETSLKLPGTQCLRPFSALDTPLCPRFMPRPWAFFRNTYLLHDIGAASPVAPDFSITTAASDACEFRSPTSRWQAGLCLPFTLLRAGRPSGASRVLWG